MGVAGDAMGRVYWDRQFIMATHLRIYFAEKLVVNFLRFRCVALGVVGPSLGQAVVAGVASLPPALWSTLLVAELYRNKTNRTS